MGPYVKTMTLRTQFWLIPYRRRMGTELVLKTSNMGPFLKTMTLRAQFWLIPYRGYIGRIAQGL